MNHLPSTSAVINKSLNAFASGVTQSLEKSELMIAPSVLGYMGGWLAGVGSQLGLFQGFVSGIYHIVIHKPFANYVNKNKGKNPDDIQPNTVEVLKISGVITGIAVPILLTKYYGISTMEKITSYLAEDGRLKWILTSKPTRQYSWTMGVLVNIAPAAVQHFISWWRKEEKINKERI